MTIADPKKPHKTGFAAEKWQGILPDSASRRKRGNERHLFDGGGVHFPVPGDEGDTSHLKRERGRAGRGAGSGRAKRRATARHAGE